MNRTLEIYKQLKGLDVYDVSPVIHNNMPGPPGAPLFPKDYAPHIIDDFEGCVRAPQFVKLLRIEP